jgi:hypothetical protein
LVHHLIIYSQDEDTLSVPDPSSLRFNFNLALILNSAYSHVPLKKAIYENNSVTSTRPADTTNKIRAGFSLGTDVLLFPKENFKLVFGVSFSHTSAEYIYSYTSENRTNRPGYTTITHETEYSQKETMSAFNFQAGVRNYVYENVFLTSSFVLTRPFRINRTTNGFTRTTYSNNSGGLETNTSYVNDLEQVFKKGDPDFSIRLHLEYQFDLSGTMARVFVFRNFGLIYKLPWWGVGFSASINN